MIANNLNLQSINGRQLYVEVVGSADAPPVVLLHHGLGSTRSWQAQLPALQEAGFRTITYDRWGYGLSDPRPFRLDPDFHQDEQDLLVLLDNLQCDQAALVGHSDGGTIALQFSAHHPDRVRCLVCVSAHIYVEPKMLKGILGVHQSYKENTAMRLGLSRLHGDKVDQVFTNWFDGWCQPENADWDMRTLLGQVACPVLVVQGFEDEHATPVHAQDLAAAIPGAELWLVEGARHMLPQEVPELFTPRLLEFLWRNHVQ
jgi:pimeloyl-ACP methyl ester carboxylesterase